MKSLGRTGYLWRLPASPQLTGCDSNSNRRCGVVDIPYPFGVDDPKCSWQGSSDFTVTCNHSTNPARPYWSNTDMEIIGITVETGEMCVYTPATYICSNDSSAATEYSGLSFNLTGTPFVFSPTRNRFTAIGCNTLALLSDKEDWSYLAGCVTFCPSVEAAASDGEQCAGLGCCQTRIAADLDSIVVGWNNGTTDDNPAWSYSPCSYAFVASEEWYNFTQEDLRNKSFINRVGERTIPWFLNGPSLTSMGHAGLVQRPAGNLQPPPVLTMAKKGFRCNCSEGYQGNPYIKDGCKDINECENTNGGPCGRGSKCQNTEGSYNCNCSINRKRVGESKKECSGYYIHPYALAAVAIFVAAVFACLLIILLQKRNQRKLFSKNGGDILNRMDMKIFTEVELKKITNSYSKPIGEGTFGKVFKGTTTDGAHSQQVAVKRTVEKKEARRRQKSLRPKATQQEQEKSWKDGFVDEITFQFKIKHANVVRLVGCCLETDIPILVFEFVGKGSLDDELHVRRSTLSLLQRLEIAIGSAEGLSHMHSAEHVHGDVKPANILLDDDLNPKVSDFGSSKLLSAKRYATEVAADGKYVDPAYYSTGRFTEKSDVYSFGVVLLELITRKSARYGDGEDQILATEFKKACKTHGNGRKMYDAEIMSDGDAHYAHRCTECLDMVGALAVRCLNTEYPDERPKMAEVVEELQQAKKIITCAEAQALNAS
ncbi:hypothetical protein BS78_05G272500 [Paspalum vaginatum]|nr:hypothetical protein BS78_05G272500 [Paspalum vaginatum]